jgi:hypothetical protein
MPAAALEEDRDQTQKDEQGDDRDFLRLHRRTSGCGMIVGVSTTRE